MSDEDFESRFRTVFSIYGRIIEQDAEEYSNKKVKLKLPVVALSVLEELVEQATEIFKNESILLQLHSPIIVVGDLHGHIIDMFRIFSKYGLPPHSKYVILGDIIDRGEFSLETLTFLYIAKVLYPDDIFIIRGNHEFEEYSDHTLFKSEIRFMYNDDALSQHFFGSFNYLPLAAIIDDYALCVHGGFGPSLLFTNQILQIQRPIINLDNEIISDILWSDPSDDNPNFEPSTRGFGQNYGSTAVSNLISRHDFSVIIRGHQAAQNGIQYKCNHRVVTVFSASNYCGIDHNQSGVAIFHPGPTYDTATFPPLNFVKRNEVGFLPVEMLLPQKLRPKTKRAQLPALSFSQSEGKNKLVRAQSSRSSAPPIPSYMKPKNPRGSSKTSRFS